MTRLWIKLWISGFAVAASVATGTFLIAEGNHRAAQDYYYNVVPWGFWGAFFIALPLLAGALCVLILIARAAAEEHRRYRAWKATLPPEQRMAVELAEAAAMTAAAVAMREHHKRVDARLTSSVMGRTMPDGHTPRPSQRIEACRQQAPPAPGPGAQDPAAASQAVIARHHPEHLDPATGDVPEPAMVTGRDAGPLILNGLGDFALNGLGGSGARGYRASRDTRAARQPGTARR